MLCGAETLIFNQKQINTNLKMKKFKDKNTISAQ